MGPSKLTSTKRLRFYSLGLRSEGFLKILMDLLLCPEGFGKPSTDFDGEDLSLYDFESKR